MNKEKGIKETRDILAAVKVLAVEGAAIMDDGRFGLKDLDNILRAIKPLKEAILGIQKVPAELKDLDGDEAKQIWEDVQDIIQSLVSAVKK